MIPRLYPADQTDFSALGYGGMREATACVVKWQLNGAYELEMQYPLTGRRFPELKHRQIITATTGPDGREQPFRVYRIVRSLDGLCTIYARHVAYDLMGHTVIPFSADGLQAALAQVQAGAVVQPHGFTLLAGFDSDASCEVTAPRTVWSMLGGQRGSLLDVYGGEWLFDRFSLALEKRIGADRGVTVRYGKNLRTLEQDENLSNCWTAVHPYWLSADGLTLVTLPEHTISTGVFDYVRVMPLDLSAEFEEAPTEEQLRQRAERYIAANQVGIPGVGLTVDFIPLEQTQEYQHRGFLSSVGPGDTVSVEFPTAFSRDSGDPVAFVTASSRVVETVWLPLEDKYQSVRLGKKRANFVSTVVQMQKNLAWVMGNRRT